MGGEKIGIGIGITLIIITIITMYFIIKYKGIESGVDNEYFKLPTPSLDFSSDSIDNSFFEKLDQLSGSAELTFR